jgi:LmbE family N-acetylglucosaminyl deacetylase
MVIAPHADDVAAFCGGTIAKMAAEGWRIVIVRVTDDRKDSIGPSVEETIALNTAELQDAARIFGAEEVVELGFETDQMANISLYDLRERFVYLFRKHRPYAVFSFDPYAPFEPNQDHTRVAQAVEEAYWVATYDKHYPEHFKEGLEPFSVCERWYFARTLSAANHVEDITDYIDTKIDAFAAHKTMVKNILNQFRRQLDTWGKRVPLVEEAFEGDPRPMLDLFLRGQAAEVADAADMEEGRLAELYRLDRFGDLEPLFQYLAEPIPDRPEPPVRPSLGEGV